MMARYLTGIMLGAALLFEGCASITASPGTSAASRQAECERSGGRWHGDTALCDLQLPGVH